MFGGCFFTSSRTLMIERLLGFRAWGQRWQGLASRIVAAVLGGYVLAALFSLAALALPVARSEAVLWGMQLSFLAYAGTVVWVFAVHSAWRAWAGILLVLVALLPFALCVWRAGGVL